MLIETLGPVLIANRGEIARRIIRTVQRLGLRAIAVHSEADAALPFVREADEAVLIGPADPARSYLDVAKVLEAARATGAGAIHPGHGFLAENAAFARAVIEAGMVWIGPSPEVIGRIGDKINARNLMEAAGVPVAPGTREPVTDLSLALKAAEGIGYPVMVKTAGGGGGIGMSVAHDDEELAKAYEQAARAASRSSGDALDGPDVLLERYVERARHVEVQILGLPGGRVVALGERDCSVQRRHQKVVEESPSPGVTAELRERLLAAAVRAGEAVGCLGVATVECLVDVERQEFVFLEMSTGLQVEHPVTELVTGLDLVELQLRVAAGESPELRAEPSGHAIEFRVHAEDSERFLPGPGPITAWDEPTGEGVRVDSGYAAGDTVTAFYDPLMAKLCVHGSDREEALEKGRKAVAGFVVEGPESNLRFCAELLENAEFVSGDYDTGLVVRMRAPAA
ncbi:acetyl-CoA carboxylase biotin carboxylase subunit [Nonomuraea antimicrobica]|uniref:acetyl-CoA carboxylase biotin carboxylase subunit n=1 Tax=Nonomuraea antimicrobica TaxID=561173 RepID=UPI0031EFEF8F